MISEADLDTDVAKVKLASDLLMRSIVSVSRLVEAINLAPCAPDQKFDRAMQALTCIAENVVDEHGPDEDWYRHYYMLTGQHMHLTEEGWIPAALNEECPMEVLDELNTPA